MSTATAIYTILNADAGVRAYVGIDSSPQHSRIYPGHAPEGAARPFIVIFQISGIPADTLDGVNNIHNRTWQIVPHTDDDYDQASAIADAVHDALEGNGYQEGRFDFYDEQTKSHSVNLEWVFMA